MATAKDDAKKHAAAGAASKPGARAAASPSRARPAGTKAAAPANVKAPTAVSAGLKPAAEVPVTAPAASASGAHGTKAAPVVAKPGSASPAKPVPRAAQSPSRKLPAKAPGTTKASVTKGAATKAKAKAAGSKGPPPAPVEPQPGDTANPEVDPAVEAALIAQREAKAAEEMEKLRAAAWQAQLELERRQEAKRRQQREEEARRKKEEAALRKALLEAAYDGDDSTLRQGLGRAAAQGLLRPDPVDAADPHGNTLLSEAAAGGAAGTAAMLLQMGADPNSRGEFQRTPLWRAAFLGHAEVVPVLLEGGADPRIGNEGGELPEHVAPDGPLKELLAGWDTARTDQLLATWEARRAERAAAVQAERVQAVRGAEQGLAAAEERAAAAQQALRRAREELEKRITEHDMCVDEKKPEELVRVTLDQIHAAEGVVTQARQRAAEAAEALDAARLQLREQQQQQLEAAGEETEALPGAPVAVKALNDVLIRDVGGKVAESGRWPLVIDPSGQASVFLRYQDTNYVNALSSRHVAPHALRRSLLGALRYGKPLVLDLGEVDLWPEMPRIFDQIQPGLLASLQDRSLLSNERYTSLIRPEDGEEYEANRFQDGRVRAFRFIVLSGQRVPNRDLVERCYALRVMVTG